MDNQNRALRYVIVPPPQQLRAETRCKLANLYRSPAPGNQVAQLLDRYPTAEQLEDSIFRHCQAQQRSGGVSFDQHQYLSLVSKVEDALTGRLSHQRQQLRAETRRKLANLYRSPAQGHHVTELLNRCPTAEQLEDCLFRYCHSRQQNGGVSFDKQKYLHAVSTMEGVLTGRLPLKPQQLQQMRVETRRKFANLYRSPAPGNLVADLLRQYPTVEQLEDLAFRRSQVQQQRSRASFDQQYLSIVSKLEDLLTGRLPPAQEQKLEQMLQQQQQREQQLRVETRRKLANLYRSPTPGNLVAQLLSRYPTAEQLEDFVFRRSQAHQRSGGASFDQQYLSLVSNLEGILTGRMLSLLPFDEREI